MMRSGVKILYSLLVVTLLISVSPLTGSTFLTTVSQAATSQPQMWLAVPPQQGPPQQGGFQQSGGSGSPGAFLTPPAAGDPLDIVRQYLRQNRQSLGLTEDDLADIVVKDRYTSQHNQVTHIYLRQRINGIEVFNGDINVNVSADGRIINLGNHFVSDLANVVNVTSPSLTAVDAVNRAASRLGLSLTAPLVVQRSIGGPANEVLLSNGGISRDDIPVKLMIQPLANGQARLAWDVILRLNNDVNWWDMRIDAETGAVLAQNDWVVNETYDVFPVPFEHPNDGGQTTVIDPQDSTASPFGWHDTNGLAGPDFTITRGNNVHAYADTDANNSPDALPGSQPDGGAGLVFDFPINLAMEPSTYLSASVTNLFYWNNIIHDIFYLKGFDEAAGNFQQNNYGNGGSGADYVQAEAQDGTGLNNANFATPPDGARPRMQMYVWNSTTPMRDGDLDNGIIIHEYGHGISNRLTGGPSNAGCLNNSEQMGEGWSDFFALALTASASDTGATPRGIGTYALGQAVTGPGIRPARYTTDMGVNSFTYGDISGQAIPHGVGFVWATMLWEMYWNLVESDGFSTDFYAGHATSGNNLALQLVVDGLSMQPCSPGFIDGRDAIFAADTALTGGINHCDIWEAFAKRGLGFSASQGSSFSTSDGTEAFDLPLECTTSDFSLVANPLTANVCAPADAQYTVQVGQILGFSEAVTLTTSGHPAGSDSSFAPNPVIPPANSSLTISNTGLAVTGSSTIDIIGESSSEIHTTTVTLHLYDAGPGNVSLTSPPDGVTDQPLSPFFSWSTATQGLSYTLDIATDMAFSNIVYSATVISTGHTLGDNLTPDTTYYWRVGTANVCGLNLDTPSVFTFTTGSVPPVLLVDDDDNNPDVRSYYTDALDTIGVGYDVWDTNNSDMEPDASALAPYSAVIWFSGVAYAFGNGPAGPGVAGEAALSNYLDDANCLFISSQDYHYDKGLTSFMTNYLGVDDVTDDVSQTSITGQGALFEGLGNITLTYPFFNYSDAMTPGDQAALAFSGNMGDAAVQKQAGYRTTFWGFPFEAMPEASRIDALEEVLNWCNGSSAGIALSPPDISSSQLADTVTQWALTITNTGTSTLTWAVIEDDASFSALSDGGEDASAAVNNLANLQLAVDDGSSENQIGDNGQFVWFNRFTPDPLDFPIVLDEIWVQFGSTNVSPGDRVDLVIHEDTDGDNDPGTGAVHLATFTTTVQVAGGGNWSVYPLSPTVLLNGPGDVLIGVVNRYGSEGFDDFPAELDQTNSQGRSWAGNYLAGDVPPTPTYPADDEWGTIDSFGFPGNWMIRAFGNGGSCAAPADIPWASVSPGVGTTPSLLTDTVQIMFDSSGLSPDLYVSTLCVSSNDASRPLVTVPLQLTVAESGPPEVALSATSFSHSQEVDVRYTQTLTISNVGGGILTWTFEADNSPMLKATATVDPEPAKQIDQRRIAAESVGQAEPDITSQAANLLNEGFEAGTVPPAGWAQIINNNSYSQTTWSISDFTSQSGAFSAWVLYDPDLVPQDEWLLSPELTITNGVLSLWSSGSLFWCREDNDNCDLEIWLVIDDVGGGDDIFVGTTDDDWVGTFEWSQSIFDLTLLLPEEPVKIGLRYIGTDGAQISVDDILLYTCASPADIPWVDVIPISGSTTASGADAVEIVFDSSGQSLGEYNDNLCLTSNDASTPLVAIPLQLTVAESGTPQVALSATSFSRSQQIDVRYTHTLTISNVGEGNLTWSVDASDSVSLKEVVPVPSEASRQVDQRRAAAGSKGPIEQDITSHAANLLNEGFEAGTVPPAGWTQVINNNNYSQTTWSISDFTSHSGAYSAWVLYDPDLVPQDEWLLSPELTITNGVFSMWSLGSLFWCRDDNDNCDLEIWLVVDDVGGVDDVFVGTTDDDWQDTFAWSQSIFNITSLLPDEPVKIGLRYIGTDGAQISVDDILLYTCSPPADIPWLDVAPVSGTTTANSSDTVEIVFDSSGQTLGDYYESLCLTSNDSTNPIVAIPLTMTVVEINDVFLPVILKDD